MKFNQTMSFSLLALDFITVQTAFQVLDKGFNGSNDIVSVYTYILDIRVRALI